MSLYDHVRDLPVEIESYALEGLELQARADFLRKTTVVHLRGRRRRGDRRGRHVHARGARSPAGARRRAPTDRHLDAARAVAARRRAPALREPLEQPQFVDYRRWAFESAALDLALRQAGMSLGEAVGREPQPVSFVVSMGLGSPPTLERVRAWLGLYPTLRFKLDATPEWTDELLGELAASGAVDSIDLKGHYRGTTVDNPPDADLYRRVADALPEAWIEDPALTDETTPVLEPHRDRVTWDAVIHSVDDIEALPWPPRTVNVKPSRFGSVERLFAVYDYCDARGIGAYGGGQWELGPGRGQIQLLAALFHPGPRTTSPHASSTSSRGPGCPGARSSSQPARPASSRRRRAPLHRPQEVVDRDERERLELRAPARAERDRHLRDGEVVRRLDDVDEVVLAEARPLVQDLRAHLLDVAVHLTQSPGVRVQRLDSLLGERRQHQVRRHLAPFLARASVTEPPGRRRARPRRGRGGSQDEVGEEDRRAHGVVRLGLEQERERALRHPEEHHESGEGPDGMDVVRPPESERSPERSARTTPVRRRQPGRPGPPAPARRRPRA